MRKQRPATMPTLQDMQAVLKATEAYAAMLRETIGAMDQREHPCEVAASEPLKRSLTGTREQALREFLRAGGHASTANALEDARNRFRDVRINEKTVARLRKELGLTGRPGRNAAAWVVNLEGRVDLGAPIKPKPKN